MPKAAAHGVRTHAGRGLPLRRLPAMDLPFLMLVLTLVGFGLVMLGSASSAVALYRRNDAFAYLRPQLLYAALGIGAMWAAPDCGGSCWRGWAAQRPSVRPLPSCRTLCPMQPAA